MKHKRVPLLLLFGFLWVAIVFFSGCTLTFTQNDTLQLRLSEPTDEVMSLVAEFEAGAADSMAGDVTQKAGSVCVAGACIIY